MHAAERRWSESRMRENRTSGSMRGCRKRAWQRACVLLYRSPWSLSKKDRGVAARMSAELKVIADFYDLMLWMIHHTEKFPRHHRHSLGVSMENRMQAILSNLLRAKYSKDKALWLTEGNIELEILRFQLRLAKDLKILAVKSYGHGAGLIESIGAQIGGWLQSQGRKS